MTVRLLKSKLPPDFEQHLEAFKQALLKHRFTKSGEAAPVAHRLIEACIKRVRYPINAKKPDDFVTDYEIVDDIVESPPGDSK